MDVDKRLFLADEKISFLEYDDSNMKKQKHFDHEKLQSEIRESFFEVKEEDEDEEKDELLSSEEDKNSDNTKEDI